MKPFKAAVPLAKWLLRFALLFLVFVLYFNTVKAFHVKNISFYIAAAYILFGVLLIIGGFISKPGLTVISGLIIFGLSVYKLIVNFGGLLDTGMLHAFILAALGFYFFARGNIG